MRRASLLAMFLTTVLAPSVGHALIPPLATRTSNPHFEDGIGGWSDATGGYATWEPDFDAADDPQSGSVRIEVPGEAGAVRELRDCVRIVGGETYIFGAQYFIPAGQVPSGQVRVLLNWYDGPNCDGYLDGEPVDDPTDVVGDWAATAVAVVSPINADSADLEIAGWKLIGQENQPNFAVYFDNAIILPEPAGALATAAALATLVVLTRSGARECRRAPSRPSGRPASAGCDGR